jgi:hypothetical protein
MNLRQRGSREAERREISDFYHLIRVLRAEDRLIGLWARRLLAMAETSRGRTPPRDVYDVAVPGDDDPVEEPPSAEVAALHTRRGAAARPLRDAARREVDVGYESDGPLASWFDDEEPEFDSADEVSPDEYTVDVADVLVAQHYAFDVEDVDTVDD